MHGPYYALVEIAGEKIRLDADDVREGELLSYRYFNSGVGRGLRLGFTRAVCLDVAKLVGPGEQANVEIVGRIGTEGRDAKDVVVGYEIVRRTERGAAVLSLGSRGPGRIWKGV